MKFKKIILTLFVFISFIPVTQGQQIFTLEQCETLARQNYPLIRQKDLLRQTADVQLEKISQANWPRMNLNGSVTYQSEVVQFPIELPNLDIPVLSKDQYRLGAEITQPLTGWITTPTHKELVRSNNQVEKEKLETELYQITDKVQQFYFGILLLDSQLEQTNLFIKDLEAGLKKTKVAILNGVALQINADIILTEKLKIEQKIIEIQSARKAYLDMLSTLVGEEINENTVLVRPATTPVSTGINRPELKVFDAHNNSLILQNRANQARTLPQAMIFLQGGYGKPGLNMLSDKWDWFYIGGLKLVWDINSVFDRNSEQKLISLRQRSLEIQRDVFLKNTEIEIKQASRELSKIEALILKDAELIELRKNIKKTLENQLENGVITSYEYLNQINAENQEKQNLALHQLQHLMAQYKLKRITN